MCTWGSSWEQRSSWRWSPKATNAWKASAAKRSHSGGTKGVDAPSAILIRSDTKLSSLSGWCAWSSTSWTPSAAGTSKPVVTSSSWVRKSMGKSLSGFSCCQIARGGRSGPKHCKAGRRWACFTSNVGLKSFKTAASKGCHNVCNMRRHLSGRCWRCWRSFWMVWKSLRHAPHVVESMYALTSACCWWTLYMWTDLDFLSRKPAPHWSQFQVLVRRTGSSSWNFSPSCLISSWKSLLHIRYLACECLYVVSAFIALIAAKAQSRPAM